MKNRLLLTAALLAFSGFVFVSCNKERIPPPSNAKQIVVSGESKSSGSTAATGSSDASDHPSGCSGSHGG